MSVQRIVEDSPEIDLQAESLHMTADTETPVSCIWHSHYQFPQFLQMRNRFDDNLYHALLLYYHKFVAVYKTGTGAWGRGH